MDTTINDIEKRLLLLTRQFLLEQETGRALRAIALNISLERGLGIDSLGKVELFHRIEKTFGVHLADTVMAEADTLHAIAQAILAAKPSQKFSQEFVPQLETINVDVSAINTLHEALIQYAVHEPERPHLYLQDDAGKEQIITYGDLLTSASNIANGLIALGVKPDDTVAIMLPTCPEFFQSFMGVLLAGAIPAPIYPPFRPDRLEEYAIRETKILNNAEVRVLITFAKAEVLGKILQSYVPSLKAVTTATNLLTKTGSLPVNTRNGDDPALLQYTSGSTGDPKGILLLHKNILANIKAITTSIHLQPTDAVVSWLPLYHDMGLMSWIASLYCGVPITILSPITFLNHPERWLWAIHYHRATLSAGPNFAYELCIKRIDEEAIAGLDLSCWRMAFNGAEAINPQTLTRFYEKFKAFGFQQESLMPVYGLAENTVAMTFPAVRRIPRIDWIDRHAFETELRAVATTQHKNALAFVCEGLPITGHQIRIVNADNQVLAERQVGRVQFCGPSAMQGYYHNAKATAAVYHDGWWDTGDLGYLADAELFITGRQKDLIIKAGRNLYPETIEDVVMQIGGIRKGCVIAFGVTDLEAGTEKIIVVAETSMPKTEQLHLQTLIIEQVAISIGVPPDQVILTPPHTIPKTSSGKLQRANCKQAYLDGQLLHKPTPVYQQMIKLFLAASKTRLVRGLKKVGRFFYTAYAALIALLTFIPTWLVIFAMPRAKTGKIVQHWIRLFFKLIFCPIKLSNARNLYEETPLIYTANHSSYMDSLALFAILPVNTFFIGKKEVLETPILSSIVKRLSFITVDRWDFSKNIEDTKKNSVITGINTFHCYFS